MKICFVCGQTNISGHVWDIEGQPVAGANIYFEVTFEGTTSDSSGIFSLTTTLLGEKVLLISFIGYESYSQSLELNNVPIPIEVPQTLLSQIVALG